MNEKKAICRQDLNAFVKGFIARMKNGPRALWKNIEGNEIVFRDTPSDSKGFHSLFKTQPSTLVGVYDTRITASDLLSDMRV